MHVQVLASGSAGNAALVRAGETHVLLDAGLSGDELQRRLEAARVHVRRLDHIVLTHGHRDHARGAGTLAKRARARVHAPMSLLRSAALARAPEVAALPVGGRMELVSAAGGDPIELRSVPVPHDADPTVALRLEAGGRALALVTDLGHPDVQVARALGDVDLLLLEFNHDADLLRTGSDPPQLKARIGGPRGHLSNVEAGVLLEELVSPRLHTLVLLHLSQRNNRPELAVAEARAALERRGRGEVRIEVARQDAVGPNLRV